MGESSKRGPVSLRAFGWRICWTICGMVAFLAAPLAAAEAARPTRPWLPVDAPQGEAVMRKPASYALPPAPGIDLEDQKAVLAHVLAGLAPQVSVLPTENYLYWRFRTEDKEIWGNVRLGPGSRDEGKLFIGYYEFREELTGPEEAHPRYAELGPGDGLDIRKLDDFLYDVSYAGKTVRFALNRLRQDPPGVLGPDEVFVFRTHDESGVQFHLLFNRRTRNFLFVANEEERPLDHVQPVGEGLVLDASTGFLFHVDAAHEKRKILIGVFRRNVAQNNYYDGPADQLSDNYIADVPEYKSYLHQAYPFTRGVIDDYGFYLLEPGNRVAVAPYYAYTSVAEVSSMLSVCGRFEDVGDLLACMVPGGFHAGADGEEKNPFAGVPGNAGLTAVPGATGMVTNGTAGTAGITGIAEASGDACGDNRPIHASLITWHLEDQTFIPPGSQHASLITWHMPNASFVPPGSKHASLVTWHLLAQTFVPPGSIHATYITWHIPAQTFIPPGTKHATYITWHFGGQSFIPPGSKHAALITWHLPSASFIPPGSKHAALVTWHIGGQSFIPPGSKHASLITWHMPNASFIPPGSKHATYITWHIGSQTFVPPGTKHATYITWHMPNASFIPPGSKHATYITWHIGSQTFVPPGTIHATYSTWHFGGQSFIPPGSKHASLITWHLPSASFIPPGSIHATYITWHINGQSFVPPGSKHATYITWHMPNASFIPPGSIHATYITWHIKDQSFVPPGSEHATYITWHMPNASFVPPGSEHATYITWHMNGQSFIPPDSKHAAYITWHIGNVSFVPPNAKHMSYITWHNAKATFLTPIAGGVPPVVGKAAAAVLASTAGAGAAWECCKEEGDCTPRVCHQTSCNPEDGNCEWAPTPGVACDDGDPFTQNDTCDDHGSCLGEAPQGDPCDDGNPCTVDDAYDAQGACIGTVKEGIACDDGNQCTLPGSGKCDAQGMCAGEPWVGASCDDGDFCNLFDVCDESGSCHAREDFECDDLQACNGEETCEPSLGCQPGLPLDCGDACAGETGDCDNPFGCVTEEAPLCEAGNPCTVTECDPILGTCTEVPLDCDDGNPCTLDLCQAIDDANSTCQHVNVANGTSCEDGIACTTSTVCSAGACGGGSVLPTAECACPPPAGPVLLTATAVGSSQVKLTWSAAGGTVQYKIFRSLTPGGPYVQVGATTGTSYSITGLTCNTKFYFQVRAFSSCGEAIVSNNATATTYSCP
jgi:hypothetical protein